MIGEPLSEVREDMGSTKLIGSDASPQRIEAIRTLVRKDLLPIGAITEEELDSWNSKDLNDLHVMAMGKSPEEIKEIADRIRENNYPTNS